MCSCVGTIKIFVEGYLNLRLYCELQECVPLLKKKLKTRKNGVIENVF